jgi:16S rRNA (cytidine1402-2'-O)-methyltransferase
LKQIEFEIQKFGSTHLFIETPFRNKQLLETLFQGLSGAVSLCIALNLTAPNAMLKTKTIRDWKQSQLPEIHKVPAVFLLGRSTR